MFGESNLVGLDIGSSCIKVAQLKKKKNRFALQGFGIKPIPPESIVDRHIMNTEAVVGAIRSLMSERRIKEKEVAISISGHSVIIKKIEMPLMGGDELQEQVRWEAEQYIPYNINDVEMDYQILRRRPTEGLMDLLLVAAKKDEIEDYMSAARDAGLKVSVIDIDSFAMQNAFEINYPEIQGHTVALVDVGAALTRLNIVREGVTLFIRDITGGGAHLTEEIQKELDISYEVAESYKVGASSPSSADVVPVEVNEILKKSVDAIAVEIQRSIDFYMATAESQNLEYILIGGGTGHCHFLRDSVQRRTNVRVEILDVFRTIEVDPARFDVAKLKSFSGQATISIGLSLRSKREKKNL
jgi:type IV pilus assembly protein PilM